MLETALNIKIVLIGSTNAAALETPAFSARRLVRSASRSMNPEPSQVVNFFFGSTSELTRDREWTAPLGQRPRGQPQTIPGARVKAYHRAKAWSLGPGRIPWRLAKMARGDSG